MAAYLVNQLRAQEIEVHKAESGKNQGDYVILLNQPFKDLFRGRLCLKLTAQTQADIAYFHRLYKRLHFGLLPHQR